MSKAQKLVNKIKRRRSTFGPKGFRVSDKIDQKDEVLQDSPKAYKYARSVQRRHNENFGKELIASPKKAKLEALVTGDIVNNLDDSATITFNEGVLQELGVQPGDLVTVLTGDLKGYTLNITSINSTEVVTEIAPITFSDQNQIKVKIKVSGLKSSYT